MAAMRQLRLPHPSHPSEGHTDRVYTIKARGSCLVSGSGDKTIRIWDLDTQRLIRGPLEGHERSVMCLQFDDSPGQDVIISGSADGCIIVWQFSTGNMLRKLVDAHEDSIMRLAFDANVLVTACRDRMIRVWNRAPIAITDLPEYMRTTKDIESSLVEYSQLTNLDGHRNSVNAICLRAETLISGSGDRTIAIWDLRTGLLIRKILAGTTSGVGDLEIDGTLIFAGCIDGTCRVYNAETGEEVACLRGHTSVVRSVRTVPSGRPSSLSDILTGSYDGSLRYWQHLRDADWTCVATLECDGFTEDGITNASMRPDEGLVFDVQMSSGRVIASGTGPLIKIWDQLEV